MVYTKILPPAIAYKNELISAVRGVKELGALLPSGSAKTEVDLLKTIIRCIDDLENGCRKLKTKIEEAEKAKTDPDKAKFIADNVKGLMDDIRVPADELEKLVPDHMWQLPKYSEMLFIM